MNHKKLHISVLTLTALLGVAFRIWNLRQTDASGLLQPDHLSTFLLVALSIISPLVLLLLSRKSPCETGGYELFSYGGSGVLISLLSGGLVLLGAMGECLFAPLSTGSLVLCFLGAVAGLSMVLATLFRKTGNRKNPAAELVPVVYLVVKLVLNFKEWSVDPIILDYFPALFALILALLAFYGCTGFVFREGCPRKTLFFCSAAIYFCAMAGVESFVIGLPGRGLTYLGLLLWLLPPVRPLLTPSESAQEP